MATHRYVIALGSNVRHHRLGSPGRVLATALAALDGAPCHVASASRIIASAPLGPSARRYANAAAVVDAPFDPPAMLAHLHRLEHRFGRRRRGRRWGARLLDLDIVLWDGGAWGEPDLIIPHPRFRTRAFVLQPAAAIAGHWRDPLTGLTLRHLHVRLTRPAATPN